MAHQADGEGAVEVHPVHGHERQQMADMEGGRCRVDADIDANALFSEEPVERVAAAADSQSWVQCHVCLYLGRDEARHGLWLMAYPATSFTKPRSSSTLSMLCCAPERMLRP